MSFIRPGRAPSLASQSSGSIDRLSISTETATPEQIGIYATTTTTVGAGSVSVRYRTGSGSWSTAHPLLRISTTGNEAGGPTTIVDAFAGSIFDLDPGTQYDIELTHVESGQPTKVSTIQRTTRSLPAAAGAATVTATTSDTLQTKFDALTPGDVLELAVGTYTVSGLTLNDSGTSGSPIYIRGVSRTGVIIKDTTGSVLTISSSCTGHVIIENLTIEGSSSDSGTAASSGGITWGSGASTTNITIRNINMVGVDVGIKSFEEQTGVLVYGCDMTGNNVWNTTFVDSNITWNDDGICLPGFGNCAWNNTLRYFGDAFSAAIDGSQQAEGIYYYRNRIHSTGDDSFEADYTTRNLAFYDNTITNCGTLLSLDPLYGGPLYCFRNTVINTIRGPLKLNSPNTGFLVYNNTIVRTEGSTNWGWVNFNNGALNNFSYRNNILIYRGQNDHTLAIENTGLTLMDFDYNAWFPDQDAWWSGSGADYTTITLAIAGSGQTAHTALFGTSTRRMQHDVVTVTDPFVTDITLGADHLTEYTGHTDATLSSDAAKNAGVSIPGITDGFSGAAPDIGSYISGRSIPIVGALPAWLTAATENQWNELSSNTLSSQDPEDSVVNPNGSGNAAPWRGNSGLTATSWWSGWLNQTDKRFATTHGGGHDDYYGNEWYDLNLASDSPSWTRLRDPTGSTTNPGTTNPNSQGEYSDGQCSSMHHYGVGAWADGHGIVFPVLPAATHGSGSNIERAHRISETDGTSTYLADSSSYCGTSNQGFSAYDSSRDVVWHSHHGSSQLFEINPSTGTITGHGSFDDYWTGDGTMFYVPGTHPAGDVLIVVSNGRELVVIRLDTYAKSQPTLSGSYATGYGLSETGAAWDPVRKKIYLWNNDSNTKQISTLTPDDPSNLLGSWTRGSLSTPAGGSTPATTPSGTYGRFRLIEDWDTLVLQTEFTNKTLFYKLS